MKDPFQIGFRRRKTHRGRLSGLQARHGRHTGIQVSGNHRIARKEMSVHPVFRLQQQSDGEFLGVSGRQMEECELRHILRTGELVLGIVRNGSIGHRVRRQEDSGRKSHRNALRIPSEIRLRLKEPRGRFSNRVALNPIRRRRRRDDWT